MKPSFVFAIIFGLLVPLSQGYLIWVQNKVVSGTLTAASATLTNLTGNWTWNKTPEISGGMAMSDNGYHFEVPNDIQSYYLVFGFYPFITDKWLGPFDNYEHKCWHLHGDAEYNWQVYPCE
ncbi:7137_t:CDS:2 [Funneliformis geosporum]|uniref:19555_t:CDS:1 n=1 Tax=Funneliformis geosporum TaxID=1117311 RepID=A0A9W4SQH6_9GLOM|nr:7137_t:CDS:2 [Funneliformis geosporum]CAI2177190.1 19555_t:CDS:2 [Funneliformis geosporum]